MKKYRVFVFDERKEWHLFEQRQICYQYSIIERDCLSSIFQRANCMRCQWCIHSFEVETKMTVLHKNDEWMNECMHKTWNRETQKMTILCINYRFDYTFEFRIQTVGIVTCQKIRLFSFQLSIQLSTNVR